MGPLMSNIWGLNRTLWAIKRQCNHQNISTGLWGQFTPPARLLRYQALALGMAASRGPIAHKQVSGRRLRFDSASASAPHHLRARHVDSSLNTTTRESTILFLTDVQNRIIHRACYRNWQADWQLVYLVSLDIFPGFLFEYQATRLKSTCVA